MSLRPREAVSGRIVGRNWHVMPAHANTGMTCHHPDFFPTTGSYFGLSPDVGAGFLQSIGVSNWVLYVHVTYEYRSHQ